LDHARCVEVLANLAEHVAALGIDRAHSEGVRIGFGVTADESQFFGGPRAKELVAANRRLQIVETGHLNSPDCRPLRNGMLRSGFPR
jgi:hypothetical protein